MRTKKRDYSKPVKSFLTNDERYSIEKLLGRQPNDFEMNMFAAMWSEHISYKSSIKWIDELPRTGGKVLVPAGDENAGIIEIRENLACVIKMESHNHPVAVNPGEAAVAVGNVFRDIVAMGAKPVALLNILRFGFPDNKETKKFIREVVESIGSYINNFGTPVVGGEILFGNGYQKTPLMNLLAVGVVRKDKIVTASFKGKGEEIYLVGGKTTGAGVHGAGFASTAYSESKEQFIPKTQLADPVTGKRLSDFIIELCETGIIKGMQDIGAGGVLCATAEMAFRGSLGAEIYLEDIPVDTEDLDPIEILLSQSQDQMLIAIDIESREQLESVAEKWKISISRIGKVTVGNRLKIGFDGSILGDLPVGALVKGGGAPVYIRKFDQPDSESVRVSAEDVPFPGNLKEVAKQMIQHPNIASRKYIYEQFDTMAGFSGIGLFYPSDAGLVRLPEEEALLALSIDGNSRYVLSDSKRGTMIAVVEAARNIICSGGEPLAIADGLNFGDPDDHKVYKDFVDSVKGIKSVCKILDIPVIAGNVSMNNIYKEGNKADHVHPTPVIGMVGLIKNKDAIMPVGFKSKGDMIYLLGKSENDLSGSEYLSSIHLIEKSSSPDLDLLFENELQSNLKLLIEKKVINSAHDISLGGLFVALVESCLPNNLGFDITSPAEVRNDAFLFGESQSRVVVSVSESHETAFIDYLMGNGFPFSALGHVTKQELRIDDKSFGFITDYANLYENALGKLLEHEEGEK